jgi:hypothetical protein
MPRPKPPAQGKPISIQIPADLHARFAELVGRFDTSRRALAAKYVTAGILRDLKKLTQHNTK